MLNPVPAADIGEYGRALSALEIPQLDINRAFSFSPRLFRAYGGACARRPQGEAETWERQALVAEKALGIDEYADRTSWTWATTKTPAGSPARARFRRHDAGHGTGKGRRRNLGSCRTHRRAMPSRAEQDETNVGRRRVCPTSNPMKTSQTQTALTTPKTSERRLRDGEEPTSPTAVSSMTIC